MNVESILESFLLYSGLLLFSFFPYFYISIKKGKQKYLFLSACIGSSFIVVTLLHIFSVPFILFSVKIVPQLAEYEIIGYLLPLLQIMEFVATYSMIVLLPLLMLGMPVLIYRRYSFFSGGI